MAGGTGKGKARVRPLRPFHRPTTEIVVTPKHSFEMVRTAMTATVGLQPLDFESFADPFNSDQPCDVGKVRPTFLDDPLR